MPKKSSEKNTETKTKRAKEKPEKKTLSQAEFESKVIALADSGLTAEKIGETLRREGIHPQEHGKKISVILKEKGLWVAPELKNMETKLAAVSGHYAKNKQDKRAMRERERIFSELRKIKKYFNAA